MTQVISIDELPSLSAQDVFDMSAKHILSTGIKSCVTDDDDDMSGQCLYGGTGCGASPFIKPEFRQAADKAGQSWYGFTLGVTEMTVDRTHCELINNLQWSHDAAPADDFLPKWKRLMRDTALKYGLSEAALDSPV